MSIAAAARFARKRSVAVSPLRRCVNIGLTFGVVALYCAVVGIFPLMDARAIIVGFVTLADVVLAGIGIGAGIAVAARRDDATLAQLSLRSLLAGAIAGSFLALLLIAMQLLDLRSIFIALSPALKTTLSFGLDLPYAVPIMIVGGAVFALIGAGLSFAPRALRQPLLIGLGFVMFFGIFQELIQIMMQFGDLVSALRETLYTWEGLTPQGALIIFVLSAGGAFLWTRMLHPKVERQMARLTPGQARAAKLLRIGLLAVLVILFPVVAGPYIGQVMMLVGLYILMGMGLNLEVGLAGLLDLGFVAFFAVGAYATALLTADSPHALAAYTSIPSLSYWTAMPIAVLCSIIVGVLFGIPVLGVRGDYLAVATMGLGEIVRVIVQSDAAAPLLAGAQGILQIPKPRIGSLELADPVQLFYLTLVSAAIAAYFAWRLENSRLGRAWMAVRDDEDVAQALGINLVKVKLLAYGLGAAFAGLSGSIFAVMLTSIYPSSFQLLISINVLALIIVGGMGSLPGVVLGAVALVGLPELLREFGEYRFLFYGVVLIVMMRIKPEGLWPSAARRRELRAAAGEEDVEEEAPGVEDATPLGASGQIPAAQSASR